MTMTPEAQAIVAPMEGNVQFIRFQPAPEIGGKPEEFSVGDAVWLSLHCPLINPFTGEHGVCAEAIVIAQVPFTDEFQVMTVSSRLVGAVKAARLKPRFPDEIAPGRKGLMQ